jgi:outer membrane protein assembly factor BamB
MSTALSFVLAFLLAPQDPPLEKAWEVEFDYLVLGAPVIHENLAIAATRTGHFKAVNIATGTPAWELKTNEAGPVTRMAVQRNLLFAPERGLMIDPVTGKVRKKYAFFASRILPGESRLYLTLGHMFDGSVYQLMGSEEVACFDPLAAKELWKVHCGIKKVSSVVEGGGRVLLTGWDQIEAIDGRTGKRVGLAERATKGWPLHGLVVGQKLIFVQSGMKSKEVVCYDAKSLKELWTWEGKQRHDAGLIPPMLVGDKLILFPLPEVVCLDTKNGKDVWSLALEGPAEYSESPPALREKEVTVGVNGKLMSFDVTGKATWSFEGAKLETNPRAHQPVWTGDRLLYSVGAKLYCFKPPESPVTK